MTLANRPLTGLLQGVLSAALLLCGQAEAASVPVGFADREIARGFLSPTALTVLPDGRVLVVEQGGVIKLIKGDRLSDTDFYTVRNTDSFAERGCLGITPDPDFATNRHIYLYCTVKIGADSHNRILRVTESGDVALPDSERTILDLPKVPEGVQWHMGGAMRFGPDGKLYVAVGNHEDFPANPPESSFAQNLGVPFGKVLRINRDGTFPADNPYVGTPGAYQGNYNLGLRNPFAMDIQPFTGLTYINDVGGGMFEEINRNEPRANYGWPIAEGRSSDSRFTNAIYEYGRDSGCAITGGAFYNPPSPQFPASFVGKYLFSDFCSGWIRVLDPANPSAAPVEFATGIANPIAITTAPDGSIYYLARNQDTYTYRSAIGTLSKIVFTNSEAPRITTHPQSQTIFQGEPVTFSVAADGALGFQWLRNGVDIPGATASSYTIASTGPADHQATFTVRVANDRDSVTSSPAVLTITTNRFPTATITAPDEGAGFAPGDTVMYAGAGTDAEDGPLAASALTWQVDFLHDSHSHPFMPATSGAAGGSLTVPSFEADAANTRFRLTLTVTDSAGQSSTTVRDVHPRSQLSEMTPVGTPLNGRGPFERNRHNGDVAADDGGPMKLDGIAYARGLGVHAPSDISYDLGGACTGNLIADVGIDDVSGDRGSAVFQVYVDGAKVFDSGLMRGSDLRKPVNVGVSAARTLRLVVTDGGDGNLLDFADWAGARVTGCPAPATEASLTAKPATEQISLEPPVARRSGLGGCTVGTDGRFDPTLPGLLALSLMIVGWRRRRDPEIR